MEPPRYEIMSLRDIAEKVPPDRIRACIEGIAPILEAVALVRAEKSGVLLLMERPLIWIDDGLSDVTVRVYPTTPETP